MQEMVLCRSLFAGLALLSTSAIAQTNAPVAFTSVPAVLVAGSSYNITWGGGDGTPVTLTLRKGDPNNLATIGVLADGVQGYSYSWDVSDELQSATDYALQITQGQASINYSGQFTITGGAGNSSILATSSDPAATSSGTSLPTGTAGIGSNTTATRSGTLHTTSTVTVTLISNSSATGQTTTATSATSAHSTTSAAPTGVHTGAPKANAATQTGGFAVMLLGVMGAVLLLS